MKEELKKSFMLLKNNLQFIPLLVFIDMVFFVISGFIVGSISTKVFAQLGYLQQLMQRMPEVGNTTAEIITRAGAQLNYFQEYTQIYSLFAFLIILIFILYLVFQGLSWNLITLICQKKQKFLRYMYRFSLVNSLWFLLVLVISYFLLKSFATEIATGLSTGLLVMIISIGAVLLYFWLLSYPLISVFKVRRALKTSFTLGIKKFKKIALMYIIIALAIAATDLLLRLFQWIHPMLMLVGGIIIALPLFIWIKLYITAVVLEN